MLLRSCIYCGRELEKDKVCDCSQSVMHRKKKEQSSENTKAKSNSGKENTKKNYSNPYKTETSYRTGYAGSEGRFDRIRSKYRAKRAARKSSARPVNTKNFFSSLWRYIIDFVKSPVDKIANPGHLSKATILAIAAIQGAVLWLCMFFIIRGGSVGAFEFLGSMMSFGGAEGYSLIVQMLLSLLSGAISGIVLFFLYSGIFYLINRFIMRLKTAYWEFSIRLASTWIPFTVICAIGILLSMLSPVTLMIMLLCGGISVAVLTYEALRTEWITQSPGKVMYSMMLGYFVFFTVVCYLITI